MTTDDFGSIAGDGAVKLDRPADRVGIGDGAFYRPLEEQERIALIAHSRCPMAEA